MSCILQIVKNVNNWLNNAKKNVIIKEEAKKHI